MDPSDAAAPLIEHDVVEVSPLLHELIREAGSLFFGSAEDEIPNQILTLIKSLLFTSKAVEGFVQVPRIRHPRLRPVFADLADRATGEGLRAEAIADRVALSPRHFRRLFKEHTGMSFKDWRALFRVQLAAERIATGASITSVAAELEFSSTSALGEVFKRHTGLTPSEFARRQRI